MFDKQSLEKFLITCFTMVIIVVMVFGAVEGFDNWIKWTLKTEKIKLEYKLIETAVNIAFRSEMFIWHVGSGAFASYFVGCTAPISVQLLIKYASV